MSRAGLNARRAWLSPAALGLLVACASGGDGSKANVSDTSPGPRQGALSYERLKAGIAHQKDGRHLEAVSAFEAALAADDENGLAYLHRAQSQILLDEPSSAILVGLEKAVQLLPDNPRAHHSYAEILAQSGEHQRAATHWRRALELRPDIAEARLGLAHVLESAGDVQGALAQLEAAATLDPRNVIIRVRLSTLLERLGRFADAGAQAREAAQLASTSAPLYRRAADLFDKASNANEAKSLRAIADRIDPPPKQRNLRELREARAKGPSTKKRKR